MIGERTLRHTRCLNDVTHAGTDIAALEHDLEAVSQYSIFIGNPAHDGKLRPYIVTVKLIHRQGAEETPITVETNTDRGCFNGNGSDIESVKSAERPAQGATARMRRAAHWVPISPTPNGCGAMAATRRSRKPSQPECPSPSNIAPPCHPWAARSCPPIRSRRWRHTSGA